MLNIHCKVQEEGKNGPYRLFPQIIPAIKAEYLAVCRGHKHSRESHTSKKMTIKRSLNNDKRLKKN